MVTYEALHHFFKHFGFMTSAAIKREIKELSENIEDDNVLSVGIMYSKNLGVTYVLMILTDENLYIHDRKDKKIPVKKYKFEDITSLEFEKNKPFSRIKFTAGEKHYDNKIEIKNNESFLKDLFQKTTNEIPIALTPSERVSVKGLPKISLEIINGQEQLGIKGKQYLMFQQELGEVRFNIDSDTIPKKYYLVKFDRVENIKKSAFDTFGWSTIGSIWGPAGSMGAALGAAQGKDISTASIFLVDKDTQEKIILIVKCDSKALSKLSTFIPTQKVFNDNNEKPSSSSVDDLEQLEKLAHLREKGILTEEEFAAKKKQLLNI